MREIERFINKIKISSGGCWEWTGCKDKLGYARFNFNRRIGQASRFSYEYFIGLIPDGLQIDHLCRNPKCVNPDHLEPVTQRENMMRGNGKAAKNARKTHCKHGHLLDENNTYFYPLSKRYPNGKRACRLCLRRWMAEFKQRKKGAQNTYMGFTSQ